jgi:hypothetical protein
MADLFELVSADLEARTGMSRLEARGTLRIALKTAGLDATELNATQMGVVLERVMPGELRARGVDDADAHCNALAAAVKGLGESHEATRESPEEIFRRLGGR